MASTSTVIVIETNETVPVEPPTLQERNSRHSSKGHDVTVAGTTQDLGAASIEPMEIHEPFPRPASKKIIWKERAFFSAVCLSFLLGGWNDASAGPLLPRIQESYNIGYTVVSMIFVANCAGFILAALSNMWLTNKLGFGTVMTIGSVLQIVAFLMQSLKPPFPLMAVSFAVNGLGMGLQDAQGNGLLVSLPTTPTTKMSIAHSAYGLGAFASPLVATQFSRRPHWSFHFLTSLGLALANTLFIIFVYRFRTQDGLLREIGVAVNANTNSSSNNDGKFIEVMRLKVRGGGPASGYISSGFFGGLTVGRVALIWANRKIGERLALYIYGALVIASEFTIWFVPSLLENALAVSFVGLALGPFYPIALNTASGLIPRRLLSGSLGWTASVGQTGSAAFPFVLALMAQKYGVQVLQPLLIGMLAFLLILWFFVPSIERRMN